MSTSTLPANARLQLASLGYKTIDEIREAQRLLPGLMQAFLRIDIAPQLAALPLPAGPPPPPPKFSAGVHLSAIPNHGVAYRQFANLDAAPPDTVDLRPLLGPVRDQGSRLTCVGFASCAAYEAYVVGAQGAALGSFAPQYLYYECKEADGNPDTPGTTLQFGFGSLKAIGVCGEALWNYNPTFIAGSEGQGPPPPAADADAPSHRIPNFAALPPTSVLEVKDALARGLCVAITIPIFLSWYGNAEVGLSGAIPLPFPGETPLRGHAVCVVGYRADAGQPGGGVFVFRNSWGTDWGTNSPDGPGHGALPYEFLTRYCREAFCID